MTKEEAKSLYQRFKEIDVSKHLEKKGQFSYLSWVFAIDQLLMADPLATWEFHDETYYGETAMSHCSVTAGGITRRAFLPVMDMRNQAIRNPDANAINKARQRCLVKAIALHGIGLNVYAGEDLPDDVADAKKAAPIPRAEKDLPKRQYTKADALSDIQSAESLVDLGQIWTLITTKLPAPIAKELAPLKDKRKLELENAA